MKRVKGGRKVIMGQLDTGTYRNRIQLFDGKFTTGYRVVEFQIVAKDPGGGKEIIGKLSTEPKSTLGQWDWSDVQELAWCSWNAPVSTSAFTFSEIREDNMAIEDLWISTYHAAESLPCNYKIVLEKYTFAAWDGAGILVENLSQAGPQ